MSDFAKRLTKILPVVLVMLGLFLGHPERARATQWEQPPNLEELCTVSWPEGGTLLEGCMFLQPGAYMKFKQYQAARAQDAYVDKFLSKCIHQYRVKKHPHLIDWRLSTFCVRKHLSVVENFRMLEQLGRDYQVEEEFSRAKCNAENPDDEFKWMQCYSYDGESIQQILQHREIVNADACMADIIPTCVNQSTADDGSGTDWGLTWICLDEKIDYVKKLRAADALQLLDLRKLPGCK